MHDRARNAGPSRLDWFMLGLSFLIVAWVVVSH
jgi:hypothetical protein